MRMFLPRMLIFSTNILLDRPFMKTVKIKTNVDQDTISMEFDGEEIVEFNIFDMMKFLDDTYSLCHIDVVDSFMNKVFLT